MVRQQRKRAPTLQTRWRDERGKRGRISYRTPQKRGDKDPVDIHVDICGLCQAAKDGVPE